MTSKLDEGYVSVGIAVAETRGVDGWRLLQPADGLARRLIREAVEELDEPVRTVAGYHLGWWDIRGRATDADTGKGIRGALVLGSAAALGDVPTHACGAAAAVELVHNFSILHDDVMDRDRVRRGRPATWVAFGAGQAILAGDAMLVLAIRVLATRPPPAGCGATIGELVEGLLQLVAGQAADLAFERRTDVSLEECLTMTAGKTASLCATACALGALSAGATSEQLDGLRTFGYHVGIALQLVDDLLGIWGDPRATGKPVGMDLRLRKKSVPVVAALTSDTPAGRQLADLYHQNGVMSDEQAAQAAILVEEAGARRWAQHEAHRQTAHALAGLAPGTLMRSGDRRREAANRWSRGTGCCDAGARLRTCVRTCRSGADQGPGFVALLRAGTWRVLSARRLICQR